MRIIREVMIIVDATDPSASLDSIIEDGATANDYLAVEYMVEDSYHAYWKITKV